MLSWMKALVSRPAQDRYKYNALENPELLRQELTDLFADDLDRPLLSKDSQAVRKNAKRAHVPRTLLAQAMLQIGLEQERRRG